MTEKQKNLVHSQAYFGIPRTCICCGLDCPVFGIQRKNGKTEHEDWISRDKHKKCINILFKFYANLIYNSKRFSKNNKQPSILEIVKFYETNKHIITPEVFNELKNLKYPDFDNTVSAIVKNIKIKKRNLLRETTE